MPVLRCKVQYIEYGTFCEYTIYISNTVQLTYLMSPANKAWKITDTSTDNWMRIIPEFNHDSAELFQASLIWNYSLDIYAVQSIQKYISTGQCKLKNKELRVVEIKY